MTLKRESLWDRISQVAEQTRNIPDWKRGSALNQRTSGTFQHPSETRSDRFQLSSIPQRDDE